MPTKAGLISTITTYITGLVTTTKHRNANQAMVDYLMNTFINLSGSTWDLATSRKARKTATANVSLTLSNTESGITEGVLVFIQDATGGRTLQIDGNTVEVNPDANSKTVVGLLHDGLSLVITSSGGATSGEGGGGGDTTAPTVVSATATDATHIQVVFSESVTVTTAGWSFKKNGSNLAITSVSGSGTTWIFVVAAMASGDTLLRSYNSGTGATADVASNELASFTDSSVTNSIAGGGGGYDTDAQAWFTAFEGAGGSLSTTQKDNIEAAIVAAKSAGIWTKYKQIIPFCASNTAAAAVINMKTPGTNNAILVNSPTLSGGVQGNGSTSYVNLNFIPSTDSSTDDMHYSFKSLTNVTEDKYDMSAKQDSSHEFVLMALYSPLLSPLGAMYTVNNGFHGAESGLTSAGLFTVTKTGSTLKIYQEEVEKVSGAAFAGRPNVNVYLGCQNDAGTATNFANKKFAISTIGLDFTATDADNHKTFINAIAAEFGL
jgi:hypothetical protein